MQEKYYYFRDLNEMKPLVTVCLMVGEGKISRGVAICSPSDNPAKKVGRAIARERARWAMKNRRSNCNLGRREAYKVLDRTWAGSRIPFIFKSEYMPALTNYEMKILEIPNEELGEETV